MARFDIATGKQLKPEGGGVPSLTTVFANKLVKLTEGDSTIVGITAAMPGGTGMITFGRRFPKCTFDLGIAEQHAVTFAGDMAAEELKPFYCIYSTFMQRGYDQVFPPSSGPRPSSKP
jgi:1-deoxy-D-xylulose-5-phosphate synthase